MARAKARARAAQNDVTLADLTRTVTESVRQALEEVPVSARTPPLFRNPRIIVGLIIEPPVLRERGGLE
jgi:hypothetical protein